MAKTFEGRPRGKDCRLAIVCGRFNEMITKALLEGCLNELGRHEVVSSDIDVVWVPGAFEIPYIGRQLARSGQYDAIIALGCVIRGATTHYDYVASWAANGIAQVAKDFDMPVIFGVLTTETIEQAIERSGTKAGNQGRSSALAALELIDLVAQLKRLGE